MEAEVTGLLQEGDRVVGVRADTPEGEVEVYADLVVGADGGSSTVRAAAGLQVEALGAPMDVLWVRLPRAPEDPAEAVGVFEAGEILVLIARADHWQCGYLIPKGGFDRLRAGGLEWFRGRIAALAPFLAGRTGEVMGWDDVSLLTVAVDRLRTWSAPGLLCIGDAAHAMSPIGGVGINLAIQDAVAAANLLHGPLRARRLTEAHLAAVQRRRAWPAHATQQLLVLAQNRIIAPALQRGAAPHPPLPLRLLARLPWLRRLPARLIGLGLRPEHVAPPLGAPLARRAVTRL
jgi:2-polyprenyl-6-methoxyphenol hydroxylase-like FAD-dependent oxidoreductase